MIGTNATVVDAANYTLIEGSIEEGSGSESGKDPDTGGSSFFVWMLVLTVSGLCLAAIPTLMKKENEA